MTSPPTVWDGVLRRLGSEIPPLSFEAWIKPLTAREEPGRLMLLAPTPFHRERVRSRFLSALRDAACALGGALEVSVELAPGACAEPEPEVTQPPAPTPRPPAAPVLAVSPFAQLTLPCTFETFVTGPSNALAREASLAVARGRQPGLFPLCLVGDHGIGKSHLARAVVAEARATPGVRVLYASAERFTTEFTSAIRSRGGGEFRRRYRQECDLLVLDDVQFLGGKEATQLELLHIVEHLRLAGARVVLTSDRLPRRIAGLSPRLASQLAGGLVAELEPPDRSLRRAILVDRASRGGVHLPPDCLELLVDGARGSVRDLEGALTQLVATASLLGRPIDGELTELALRKHREPARELHTVDAVITSVGGFFGLSRAQLASRVRSARLRIPRQLAMYLCRRYTDASLSEIGRALGRNHSAVANAIQNVERAVLERAPVRYQVEELAARIEGRSNERRLKPKARTEERGDASDRARPGSDEGR